MTKANLYKVYSAIALITIAIIGCLFYFNYTASHPSTDNAYVKANNVTISSQVNGKVLSVNTCNYSRVKKGQILFSIDKKPFQLAVDKAEANTLNVQNSYRVLQNQIVSSQGQITIAEANLHSLQDHLRRLKATLKNSQNAVAKEQIVEAEDKIAATQGTLKAAIATEKSLQVQMDDKSKITMAETALNQAKLNLKHCDVKSPVTGVVNRLSLQPGENVVASSPLFTVVDTSHYWISANFKETKLDKIKKGQKVSITFDALPKQIYHGVVSHFSPATGSIGSLLQPENATGNWIKVTQRIPVKILINGHPSGLIIGQSANVTIDTHSHE